MGVGRSGVCHGGYCIFNLLFFRGGSGGVFFVSLLLVCVHLDVVNPCIVQEGESERRDDCALVVCVNMC